MTRYLDVATIGSLYHRDQIAVHLKAAATTNSSMAGRSITPPGDTIYGNYMGLEHDDDDRIIALVLQTSGESSEFGITLGVIPWENVAYITVMDDRLNQAAKG